MVVHADTLKTNVTALYTQPSKPLQFEYTSEGMHCEFTLMTIGESLTTDGAPAQRTAAQAGPSRQASNVTRASSAAQNGSMPPPPLPTSRIRDAQPRLGRRVVDHSNQASQAADQQSLFVPPDDDDSRWEPAEEQEEEQDVLGWDASGDHVSQRSIVLDLANCIGCTDADRLRQTRFCGYPCRG